jgi:hypothetical protein
LAILLRLFQFCVACESQCEDIRDKIFGFIGLVNRLSREADPTHDRTQALGSLAPDYSKKPTELYVDGFFICCRVVEPGKYDAHDERLVRFTEKVLNNIQTIQRLLENPVWSQDRQFLEPLNKICGAKRQGLLGTVVSTVKLRSIGIISCIGFQNVPPEAEFLIDSTCLPQAAIRQSKERLSQLTVSGLHSMQTIGTRCTFNHLSWFSQYVPVTTLTTQASSTPSTGRCRLFMIQDEFIGISSCDIQETDVLCKLIHTEKMYMIVRLEERIDKNHKLPLDFTVIGKAMILWEGFHENLLGSKDFFHAPENWESKSIP